MQHFSIEVSAGTYLEHSNSSGLVIPKTADNVSIIGLEEVVVSVAGAPFLDPNEPYSIASVYASDVTISGASFDGRITLPAPSR